MRFVLRTIGFALVGVLVGPLFGAVIGTVTGLVFGGIREGIAEGVLIGAVLGGITFALIGVQAEDEDLSAFLAWRKSMSKTVVLFLCTHNTARSQMAEALLKKKAADHFDAYSAGSEPSESIHPLTLRVMSEVGIDLSSQRPKHLAEYLGCLPVRVAISVCPRAEAKCPTSWPGTLAQLQWPVEDPTAGAGNEDERLARFRAVRDQIDEKLTNWLSEVSVSR